MDTEKEPAPPATDKALVELPAAPPEGFEIVALFSLPVPLEGMSELLKAVCRCYGDDAKLLPQTGSEWVGVIAAEGRHRGDLLPAKPEGRAFRVCEVEPQGDHDGMKVLAPTARLAIAEAVKKHVQLREYPALWVWRPADESYAAAERMDNPDHLPQ